MRESNEFEDALRNLPEISPYKTALIEVVDTAYFVRQWFKSYGIEHSGADVVALTALILDRERKLERNE